MSAPSSEESVSLLEEYQHYSDVQYESVSNFDKGLRNKEQVLQLHYFIFLGPYFENSFLQFKGRSGSGHEKLLL